MGSQGILSSLCPIHTTDNAQGNDPLFGYRPAITSIVNRLKNALSVECLPEKLSPVPDGQGGVVQCLILATLPNNLKAEEATVCNQPKSGLSVVTDPAILTTFQANQHAVW